MHRPRLLALLVLTMGLLPRQDCRAAIVDTLKGFEPTQPGWSGEVAASFSARSGNSEVVAIGSGAQVQWQSDRHRVRLLGSYEHLTSRGRDLDENAMIHLRHNRRLVGPFHSLVFAQLQRDPFQRLQSRALLGAGVRWDAIRGERGELSWGASHMFERERIEDEPAEDTDHRLSTFLSLGIQLNEQTRLTASGFAQPRWADLGDLRAIARVSLSVSLSANLKLVWGGSLQHDANPPASVEQTDLSTQTGLTLKL